MYIHTKSVHYNYDVKQVCLPALHITLGIFYRLFNLLENECHKLDLKSALLRSSVSTTVSYATYATAMQKVQQITEDTQHLQAQLKDVTQLVSYFTLHLTEDSAAGLMTGLHQRLVDIRQSIADLVSKYKSIKTDHCITFPQEKEKKKHEAVSRKGLYFIFFMCSDSYPIPILNLPTLTKY